MRHLRGMLSASAYFCSHFLHAQLLQSQPFQSTFHCTQNTALHKRTCQNSPLIPLYREEKLRPRRRNRNGAPAQPSVPGAAVGRRVPGTCHFCHFLSPFPPQARSSKADSQSGGLAPAEGGGMLPGPAVTTLHFLVMT